MRIGASYCFESGIFVLVEGSFSFIVDREIKKIDVIVEESINRV